MNAIQQLAVDTERCVGCQACTHTCHAGFISFEDREGSRTIRFARTCREDCRKCAEACSETAIALAPGGKDDAPGGFVSLHFGMARCVNCSAYFATERMMEKLRASLPSMIVPETTPWITACLSCRRQIEADHAVRPSFV